MATSCSTLIQRTRRFLGDWPEQDALTASLTSSSTTFTVADATIYSKNWLVQIDQEAMQVRSGTGTTVTVLRGARGTTAASHANSATVLIKPAFIDLQIQDALNAGINAAFPLIYKQVLDTTLSADSTTYEFTVPTMPSAAEYIPYISRIELQISGDTAYRPIRNWDIRRGATPKIMFRRAPETGTIRVVGFGPFPSLATSSSTLDALWPVWTEDLLVEFAAQRLLEQGEAQRVRQDTGAQDQRENANRAGSSMNAANAVLQRFQIRLRDAAMPPMPRHVVSVF